MVTLRHYQEEAVQAIYRHLIERDDNPCVVIPTGGGKTPVLATVCKDAVTLWKGRVLIIAHVKELIEQAVYNIKSICPEVNVGIYSAGLKRRDTDEPVIVASIQSVYKQACDLGAFDLVIIDEAHLIPPDGEGMYRTFLEEAHVINPHLRVIGLTATPFRMKTGMICHPDNVLNNICYEISVKDLIVQGFLSPLISKAGGMKVDTSGLHVRGGEFIAGETEKLMDQNKLVKAACHEIVVRTRDRRACLIFASGVKHGLHIVQVLRQEHNIDVEPVFGDTLTGFRDRALKDFREGRLKYLVNVNVLTTGFDAPNIDCVALVRPTLSPGLYYQMVGRGFRTNPGKENCLVLDFGGNVMRHGPVDMIRVQGTGSNGNGKPPAKECLKCRAVIATEYAVCPQCGHEFPSTDWRKHGAEATDAPILSGEVTTTEYKVQDVRYNIHTKRGADPDHPKSMRVEYRIGCMRYHKEWICFEHTGRARMKAKAWWELRSDAAVPMTAEEAVRLAEEGALASTHAITVRSIAGKKYTDIINHTFGEKPPWREPGLDDEDNDWDPASPDNMLSEEEVPF